MISSREFYQLDVVTQAALRRVAVRMVQAGNTRIEAAAVVGVSRHFVGVWIATVERSGEAALVG